MPLVSYKIYNKHDTLFVIFPVVSENISCLPSYNGILFTNLFLLQEYYIIPATSEIGIDFDC